MSNYVSHMSRTLSGWLAVTGFYALLTGRRKWAVWCWRVLSIGGVGAVYGAYATMKNQPVRPVAVCRELMRDPKRREPLVSAAWHGAFLVFAELANRRGG